ncbi:MAG: ThiF family adenylyltransferase [Bacilli bacterium]|nr:ThiF family adenylyltransferase [Bacilli bacterium]
MRNLERLEDLFGIENINKLKRAKVAIIGLGGVGGVAALALARSGISYFIIQDNDIIQESNINRQLIANYETLNLKKVEVMDVEIKKVNPHAQIIKLTETYNTNSILFDYEFDYLIDAIDSINDKFELIKQCLNKKIVFISAMGAAKKLDPSKLAVMDINKTTHDPLAKILRRKLRDENINNRIMVVSSTESRQATATLGSYICVTATAGLLLADYIIKRIISGGIS